MIKIFNRLFNHGLISLSKNPDLIRRDFHQLADRDRGKAIRYLNGDKIKFPYLFVLMPEIESLDFHQDINNRNCAALKTCAHKLNNNFSIMLILW